jgi:hypothetical protein
MKSYKQYLLEYDTNNKPMPGYSYDEQEPELRSDEDAEKTKEWYTNVAGDGEPSRTRSGDTQVYQSEVDLEGRPTGRTMSSTVMSPENKAREEEMESAYLKQKWEGDVNTRILDNQRKPKFKTEDDRNNEFLRIKFKEEPIRARDIPRTTGVPMDDLA